MRGFWTRYLAVHRDETKAVCSFALRRRFRPRNDVLHELPFSTSARAIKRSTTILPSGFEAHPLPRHAGSNRQIASQHAPAGGPSALWRRI